MQTLEIRTDLSHAETYHIFLKTILFQLPWEGKSCTILPMLIQNIYFSGKLIVFSQASYLVK